MAHAQSARRFVVRLYANSIAERAGVKVNALIQIAFGIASRILFARNRYAG
jgi:hypothetical protein